MGASLRELIARAGQIASGRGIDPNKNPMVDTGMTLEALAPHAITMAVEQLLDNGQMAYDNVCQTHDITVTSGVGTLPSTVMKEHLQNSFLPTDAYAAYVPYPDYLRHRYNALLHYYATKDSSFYYSGSDGTVSLHTATTYTPPDDPDDDLGLSKDVSDAAVLVLVGLLTGEIKLADVLKTQ